MSETKSSKNSILGIILAVMNGLGSICIASVALLICADIIGRSVFNSPIAGVAELVSLSVIVVVFLQLGQAVRTNSLARTGVVLNKLEKNKPRFGSFLNGIYYLIAALLFLALMYGSYEHLLDAWEAHEHIGVYGLFVAPIWPMRLVVVISCFFIAVQYSVLAATKFSEAFNPRDLTADAA